jgi:multiple sugar transport system permease protein
MCDEKLPIEKYAKYLFLLPCLIYVFALTIFPSAYSLALSFTSWLFLRAEQPTFIGIENFLKLLEDGRFWVTLSNTLIFVFTAATLELIVGLALAVLLSRETGVHKILRAICLTPMIATPVGVGWIWRMLLNEGYGPINHFLSLVGLPRVAWLSDPRVVLFSIVLIDVWQWTPFVFLMLQATIQSLPKDPFEAAQVYGASKWQLFRYLTLPMIAPTMVVVYLLRLLEAFKVFDVIFATTGGGPGYASESITMYTYYIAMKFWSLGYASAAAYTFFAIILVVSILLFDRIRRRMR